MHAIGVDVALEVDIRQIVAGNKRPAADALDGCGNGDGGKPAHICKRKPADLFHAFADDHLFDGSIVVGAVAAAVKAVVADLYDLVTADHIRNDHRFKPAVGLETGKHAGIRFIIQIGGKVILFRPSVVRDIGGLVFDAVLGTVIRKFTVRRSVNDKFRIAITRQAEDGGA